MTRSGGRPEIPHRRQAARRPRGRGTAEKAVRVAAANNRLVADDATEAVDQLLDQGPDRDRIGRRDLGHWSTPAGRRTVRTAERLHGRLSAAQVLFLTLAVGFAVAVAATAAV